MDNFHYAIILPKNSLELKLKLEIKGRKNDRSAAEEKEEYAFMGSVGPEDILKLKKEDVIQDVIRFYRKFVLEAITDSR